MLLVPAALVLHYKDGLTIFFYRTRCSFAIKTIVMITGDGLDVRSRSLGGPTCQVRPLRLYAEAQLKWRISALHRVDTQ